MSNHDDDNRRRLPTFDARKVPNEFRNRLTQDKPPRMPSRAIARKVDPFGSAKRAVTVRAHPPAPRYQPLQ
jgi:hypothetical protein